VSLPSDLVPLVSTVSGLDTTARALEARKKTPPAPAGSKTGRPCSAWYGEKTDPDLPQFEGRTLPITVCGYAGPTLRSAYAGSTALTGRGVTVAVVDAYASPTIAQDAAAYVTAHGGEQYAKGQLTQVLAKTFKHTKACDETGWWGEETLDVEAVHAIAPKAGIVYYGASSCYDKDFIDTLQRVVDDNKASLVSNSWGGTEQGTDASSVAAYQSVFLQGAMQGIGFVFSSGDDGDELANTGTKQVDYPTSDPTVTSVGGTVDAIGQDGRFLWQTGWGSVRYVPSADGTGWVSQGFLAGAGGGVSTRFAKPAWQTGVPGTMRAVPDTAATADPMTGMLVGQTQAFPDGTYYSEYRIGGTSLAAPLFAGMTALRAEQQGRRLGFLNPAIYGNRAAFTDVTGTEPDPANVRADFVNGFDDSDGIAWSLRTFDRDSSLATTPGWDQVTGVGRPNPGWFSVR
jgi:subtilase family serine protease